MKHVEFQYAKALLEIALEKKIDEKLYDFFHKTKNVLDSKLRNMNYFFENPSISIEEKNKMFFQISDMEKEYLVEKFFSVLFANKRFRYITRIINSYIKQYEKKTNLKRVQIVFASSVNDETSQYLKTKLTKKMEGFRLVFDHLLDPNLIGGYKVILEDIIIDGSLKTKINNFITI